MLVEGAQRQARLLLALHKENSVALQSASAFMWDNSFSPGNKPVTLVFFSPLSQIRDGERDSYV